MPTRDASSPVRFTTTTNGVQTLDTGTSASFSPPANSWLYFQIDGNETAGTISTFNTPTNTGTALSWSLVGSRTNASGGSCGVFRAFNLNAQVGITVTGTITYTAGGAPASGSSSAGWVDVWTGADTNQSTAAVATSTSTAKTNNPAVTTTRTGSRVVLVGLDWTASGNPTSSDTIDAFTVAGQTSGGRAFKAADSGAPGSVSVNFVCAGASGTNSFVVYEILAPISGATPLVIGRGPGLSPGLPPASARFYTPVQPYPASASADVTVALSGALATFSAGTLGVQHDQALTNALGTFSAGTVTPATTVALTNAVATFSAGSLTPATTVSLTNSLATFSAGNVSASGDVTVALTGALGTWSAGTLTANPTVGLTNASATFSAGTLTQSSSVALTNALAVWSAGDMGVQGDVTVALTGAGAVFSAGSLGVTAAATTSTPGMETRVIRKDWWKGRDETESRSPDREAPTNPTDPDEFVADSIRIAQRIGLAKAESATLRARIANLEQQAIADGIRTIVEQRRIERELLEAQQLQTLLAVQEAVLREEMEVIDIAYVAFVAQSILMN